jgi:hypothetical protein
VLLSLVYLALRFVLQLLVLSFRSEEFKELEIVVLRHELAVVRRQVARPHVRPADWAFLTAASRLLPRARRRSSFVTPDTLGRWHRDLVRRRWSYPRRRSGRPELATMSANSCGPRTREPALGQSANSAASGFASPPPASPTCPAVSAASAPEEWRVRQARSRRAAPLATAPPPARTAGCRSALAPAAPRRGRTAGPLDLVGHPPPRRERVVLLARVDADSQPLLGPPQRLKRSPSVAGGAL